MSTQTTLDHLDNEKEIVSVYADQVIEIVVEQVQTVVETIFDTNEVIEVLIPGIQGPKYTPKGLVYKQTVPAYIWVVPHTYTYNPNVTVVDDAGTEMWVQVDYAAGKVTITFGIPMTGTATLT